MDYKVTFQDGSEALAHYGVLGMKWGVWNSETRARRSGEGRKPRLTAEQKARYKEVAKVALKGAAVGAAIIGGRMLVRAALTAALGPVGGAAATGGVHGAARLSQILLDRPDEYNHIVDTLVPGFATNPGSNSYSSMPSHWADYGYPSEFPVHTHVHNVSNSIVESGSSITQQLLNANIPDSLKRKK